MIAYALLPRPTDLVIKSAITLGALAVTALALHVPFSRRLLWTAVLVIVCIDVLAKQATYIWNDIRDFERDSLHPHKRARALPRLGTPRPGLWFLFARAAAAVALSLYSALGQGLWWLLPLVAFIFAWQYLYDSWGKWGPVRRLCVVAGGYAERALAGAGIALTVVQRLDLLLLVLVCAQSTLCAALGLAEYWRLEALYLAAHGTGPAGTDAWFGRHGARVVAWATIALFPLGLSGAYLYSDGALRAALVAWTHSAGLGVVLAIAVTCVVGVMLRRALLVDVARRRGWWLGGIALITALLLVANAPLSRLATLALALPLFCAAATQGLTYEEIARLPAADT